MVQHTALRAFAGNKDTVQLEGQTVGELLEQLSSAFPQMKKHIFDDQGKLRTFVNVYVNDDDIRQLQKEETKVSPKDVISIIPSVAGGAESAGYGGTPGGAAGTSPGGNGSAEPAFAPPGLVPSCAEGGVLGVLPRIIGTIQATETVKLIIGRGQPLSG